MFFSPVPPSRVSPFFIPSTSSHMLLIRKCKRTPHNRFSKVISRNAKTLESALLAEPHVAVILSCRTLTPSAKVSCRTLQIAEPKALNLEKDYLAEPSTAGSFRICPFLEGVLEGARKVFSKDKVLRRVLRRERFIEGA